MKKVLFSFAILSVSVCSSAQTAMPDFSGLGYKKPVMYTSSKGEFEEFHDQTDVVEIGTVLFNTKTKAVVGFVSDEKAKTDVSSATTAMSVDPMCEKYYWISPYAYCNNNPVNNIDPFGMDVYRYDDKTGQFYLAVQNNDKFDQVGKFKTVTNKETGEKSYELKTNKDGTAKTRIDNVEKGILSDGINFMKNDNVIAVGGKEQASVGGVEAFAVNLSDMVGKEISGAYFSKDGAEATTQISIDSYQNNTLTQSGSSGHALWQRMNPDSQLGNSITGFFHTHPTTGYSVSDRTRASDQDKSSRDAALKLMPNLQFYILTHPINYGDKFPYKIPYKNAW